MYIPVVELQVLDYTCTEYLIQVHSASYKVRCTTTSYLYYDYVDLYCTGSTMYICTSYIVLEYVLCTIAQYIGYMLVECCCVHVCSTIESTRTGTIVRLYIVRVLCTTYSYCDSRVTCRSTQSAAALALSRMLTV